jgi:hypothetical protein
MGLGQGLEATKHGQPAIVLAGRPPIVPLSPHFLHTPLFLGPQHGMVITEHSLGAQKHTKCGNIVIPTSKIIK